LVAFILSDDILFVSLLFLVAFFVLFLALPFFEPSDLFSSSSFNSSFGLFLGPLALKFLRDSV